MNRTLALKAKQFTNPLEPIPKNGREFFLWTKGNGIVCKGCNSKVFYAYPNWKNHLKTKKHQKWLEEVTQQGGVKKKKDSKNSKQLTELRQELKNQKAMTVKYCNLYEQTKNKLSMVEKELKRLKREIEKKFDIK